MVEITSRRGPYHGKVVMTVATSVAIGELVPELPTNVNAEVRKFLEKCWKFQADERPDFDEVYKFAASVTHVIE